MDDRDLLNLYREGRQEYAFNLIVKKYSPRIYWHIRKMVISHEDADDLTQNTLVKVWKNLPNFREEAKLYTWLYRIATNEVLTFLRKKKLQCFISLSECSKVLESALESDPYFNGDKLHSALMKAVINLPHKQRLVFNMRYFDDMKYEDISQVLGTSVGALKASYHHAFQKVQEAIKELV